MQAKDYGVRYVFPFLDYRVIDYAVSISRRLYHHNGQNRYIYREAFKDLMSNSLRKVNYKDTASHRPSHNAEEDKKQEKDTDCRSDEITKEQEEWVQGNLNSLDWNRWKKYFDRNACEQLLRRLFVTKDKQEEERALILTSVLLKCSLIQNLQDYQNPQE